MSQIGVLASFLFLLFLYQNFSSQNDFEMSVDVQSVDSQTFFPLSLSVDNRADLIEFPFDSASHESSFENPSALLESSNCADDDAKVFYLSARQFSKGTRVQVKLLQHSTILLSGDLEIGKDVSLGNCLDDSLYKDSVIKFCLDRETTEPYLDIEIVSLDEGWFYKEFLVVDYVCEKSLQHYPVFLNEINFDSESVEGADDRK